MLLDVACTISTYLYLVFVPCFFAVPFLWTRRFVFWSMSFQELFEGTLLPDRKLKTLQQMEPVCLGFICWSNSTCLKPQVSLLRCFSKTGEVVNPFRSGPRKAWKSPPSRRSASSASSRTLPLNYTEFALHHVQTLPTPVSRKDYLKTAYAAFVQARSGRTDLLLSMDWVHKHVHGGCCWTFWELQQTGPSTPKPHWATTAFLNSLNLSLASIVSVLICFGCVRSLQLLVTTRWCSSRTGPWKKPMSFCTDLRQPYMIAHAGPQRSR